MSTITKPMTATITVEEYERMIEEGEIGEHDQEELIKGRIVVKMGQGPWHAMGAEVCRRPIERLTPAGWHCRIERPIRLSEQDSEPVPDLSIVRGGPGDYADRHPEPADVALIVEVAKTSLQQDREQSVILGAVGISVYWVVNIEDRQLDVYAGPGGRRLSAAYDPG